MPLDPTISLQAGVPQFQQRDPIQTMGSLAIMQNQLNQARLFQQTFAAKMQMGQIIAGSPDLDSAFANITKSGLIGYAPEIATMLKGLQQTDVNIAGERIKQAGSALDMVGHLSAIAFNDPSKLPMVGQIANSALPANTPPNVRAALNNYISAITPDSSLPQAQQAAQAQTSVVGAMTAAGTPLSVQEGVTGTPLTMQNALGPTGQVGTAIGRQMPISGAQIQSFVPTGLSPTTVPAPGGGSMLAGGGYGAPVMGGQAGQAGPAGPLGIAPATGSAMAPAAAPPGASGMAPTAGDGTPLYTPGSITRVPLQPVIGGVAPTSEALKLQNDEIQKEFGANGQKELNNARLTQGSVSEIKAAFNNLMTGSIDPKTGQPQPNFLSVGAGGQFRANLANLINTTGSIIGMPPVVDPGKVSSAQDLMKATNRLGVQYTVQMLGGQREAASTIERLTSGAQPNLGNTYLGGMLVANMVNAGSTRAADWRRYQAAVMSQNNGFISNQASVDFDSQHPYSSYVSTGFDNFKSDVQNAFKNNYISRGEATSALRTVLTAQAEMQQSAQAPGAAAAPSAGAP